MVKNYCAYCVCVDSSCFIDLITFSAIYSIDRVHTNGNTIRNGKCQRMMGTFRGRRQSILNHTNSHKLTHSKIERKKLNREWNVCFCCCCYKSALAKPSFLFIFFSFATQQLFCVNDHFLILLCRHCFDSKQSAIPVQWYRCYMVNVIVALLSLSLFLFENERKPHVKHAHRMYFPPKKHDW